MARPRKHRRVCGVPNHPHFGPKGNGRRCAVVMSLDEFETVRLIDYEALTQEECALQMDVARTTVQAIYAVARKKIAECLVEGKHLEIGGGDVVFCEHSACIRKRDCCHRKDNRNFSKESDQDG